MTIIEKSMNKWKKLEQITEMQIQECSDSPEDFFPREFWRLGFGN